MKNARSEPFDEEHFRTIADSAPFAIVITRSSDGTFVYVNDYYCNLIGAPREHFIGKLAQDLYVNPDDRKTIVAKLKTDGFVNNGDVQLKRALDLSPLWVSFSAHLGDLNGEQVIYASLYDINERKKSEERLQEYANNLAQSNAELEQFAYIASHDLQEPLRMIGSYLQLLEQRYKGKLDKDADDFISYAVDGSNRLQRMINDLLVFSRVQTRGKVFGEADTEMALENALQNLRRVVAESGAQITHDPLPFVAADPVQLTMLFQNLLSNAMKFKRKATPKIRLSAELVGDFYQFCVEDNGIGIDPKDAERIFVIFQRLHSREQYPGNGIGLAVCRRIVARHGGHIWVEPQLGKGSRFYFTIPKNGERRDDEK